MKDNNITDRTIEELLKNKMDALSDSVDCFDKISDKAFPKSAECFFEGGYVISDVENITGKKRSFPIIKWTAIAAAAAVCIAVIPKTPFFRRFMDEFKSTKVEDSFIELADKISFETEKYDYTVYDVSLDYYIKNDILVTPMFPCPFDINNAENTNVRIFVKNISGTPTNQIYAVEYADSYSEENFIAIASSGVEITENDILSFPIDNTHTDSPLAYEVIPDSFSENDKEIVNSENMPVNLASFHNQVIFKLDGELNYYQNEVIYGNSKNSGFYDIIAYTGKYWSYPDDDKIVLTDRFAWETSMYINGVSALPKNNKSEFERTELFSMNPSQNSESKLAYLQPFTSSNSKSTSEYEAMTEELNNSPYDAELEIEINNHYQSNQFLTNMKLPISVESKQYLTLYFSAFQIYQFDKEFLEHEGNSVVVNGMEYTSDNFIFSSAYLQYMSKWYDEMVSFDVENNIKDDWMVEELDKHLSELSKADRNKAAEEAERGRLEEKEFREADKEYSSQNE